MLINNPSYNSLTSLEPDYVDVDCTVADDELSMEEYPKEHFDEFGTKKTQQFTFKKNYPKPISQIKDKNNNERKICVPKSPKETDVISRISIPIEGNEEIDSPLKSFEDGSEANSAVEEFVFEKYLIIVFLLIVIFLPIFWDIYKRYFVANN